MTTNGAKAGEKKKANITDRETANRAKVYVYGMKAHKQYARRRSKQRTYVLQSACAL